MSDDSVSSRLFRRLTFLTTLASMSSAKESNCPPLGVRKLIAASERRRSFFGAAKDGKYQATTFIPRVRGVDEAGLAGRSHDVHRLAIVARFEEERPWTARLHLGHERFGVSPRGSVVDVHPGPQAAVGGEVRSGYAGGARGRGEEQIDGERGERQPGQSLELLPRDDDGALQGAEP